jgi:PiT family inorganic phosphate transporter
MPDPMWLVVLVVILALIFDFTNGRNDAANAIATVVSTRTLSPLQALLLSAVLNLAGAFFSTALAKTIGKDIVDPKGITLLVIVATLLAAILWNTAMGIMGLPISSSHALIGSLVGAAIANNGWDVLRVKGIFTILIALLVSPLLGGVLGYAIMKLIRGVFAETSPSKVKKWFRPMQIVSASFMSFSHGTSDAQKAMGIITLALFTSGYLSSLEVPTWVMISAGLAMAIGTAAGGWRIIQTMGDRLSRLETPHGFSAETAAALILTTVAKIGVPVSSTHTITGAIIGVGAAERIRSVRWSIAGNLISAWVLTRPGTAVMGFILYYILRVLEP